MGKRKERRLAALSNAGRRVKLDLFAGPSGMSSADISKIEIDEEFARRYEHNKEREDLHRFQELQKKGLIGDDDLSDSESSSPDDDDDYDGNNEVAKLGKKEDVEFFKNLIKVRNRDPSIYQNVSLFGSDSSDADIDIAPDDAINGEREEEGDKDEGNMNKKNKKKRSMYLKDVVAQHLMEEGPEFDENDVPKNNKKYKTYDEEQRELKNALLDAIHDAEEQQDGDGGFLKVKEKNYNENIADGDNVDFEKKLSEYFGQEEELDENNLFLKEFFLNKMWVDKGHNDGKAVFEDDDVSDLSRDEEDIEKQEEYEENYYKFRYQENAGDRVMGHSRKVEGSVRKKPSARKSQRQRKEENLKIAEMERKEELKHLKNVKKKEMKEKMKKVMDAAGIKDDNDCLLDLDDLEDEFDPEEYDKMMKKAFNDKYYEAEDVDPHFGHDSDEDAEIGKPDFDKEDEILGLPKDWDVLDSSDGFLAARERVLERKSKNDIEEDNDKEEEEEGEAEDHGEEERSEESKRKRKRKMSLVKKAKEEMMEEYYKLDYEGTIGDLKTRFKYAKVDPNRYGLKTYEILMSDDKDLNQYVSVKKLAPYKEKEWKVPNNQRYQYKTMLKERLRGKGKDEKSGKKSQKIEESNVDLTSLSRNVKRRRRKAELSLSRGRLWAYGKIPPGSKSKGKH